jgi:hypothetical protein
VQLSRGRVKSHSKQQCCMALGSQPSLASLSPCSLERNDTALDFDFVARAKIMISVAFGACLNWRKLTCICARHDNTLSSTVGSQQHVDTHSQDDGETQPESERVRRRVVSVLAITTHDPLSQPHTHKGRLMQRCIETHCDTPNTLPSPPHLLQWCLPPTTPGNKLPAV